MPGPRWRRITSVLFSLPPFRRKVVVHWCAPSVRRHEERSPLSESFHVFIFDSIFKRCISRERHGETEVPLWNPTFSGLWGDVGSFPFITRHICLVAIYCGLKIQENKKTIVETYCRQLFFSTVINYNKDWGKSMNHNSRRGKLVELEHFSHRGCVNIKCCQGKGTWKRQWVTSHQFTSLCDFNLCRASFQVNTRSSAYLYSVRWKQRRFQPVSSAQCDGVCANDSPEGF